MLLPSAIQRSEDLVGIATPTVPLSPPSPPSPPPHAARPSASAAAVIVVSTLRTYLLHFTDGRVGNAYAPLSGVLETGARAGSQVSQITDVNAHIETMCLLMSECVKCRTRMFPTRDLREAPLIICATQRTHRQARRPSGHRWRTPTSAPALSGQVTWIDSAPPASEPSTTRFTTIPKLPASTRVAAP